jgi:hypothetical protein
MTGGSTYEPWPDQPDDEYPDFLWPHDDDERDTGWPAETRQQSGDGRGPAPGHPVPCSWPVPPVPFPAQASHDRKRRLVALTATAVAARPRCRSRPYLPESATGLDAVGRRVA